MDGKASFSIENLSSDCFVNFNPYFDAAVLDQSMSFSASFEVSDESSLIEMDPQMPPSQRFYRVSKDFSIDFQSPDRFRISDACFLLPIFVQQLSKAERPLDHDRDDYDDHGDGGTYSSFLSTPRTVSSLSQREELPSDDIPCSSLRRCRIISKRIFHKYLGFFRPLCRKLRCRRRRGSGSKVASVSTQTNSPASPSTSPMHSVVGVANKKKVLGSDDSEFCIHDAVLHCKRTNVEVSSMSEDVESIRKLLASMEMKKIVY